MPGIVALHFTGRLKEHHCYNSPVAIVKFSCI